MNLQNKIAELKSAKNAIILVHNYQRPEIQELADYLGDSLGLARIAAETKADLIVFCGVRFMAETAKILSPDKKVLLPVRSAGCPMADMATAEDLSILQQKHPEAKTVAYVNSSVEVKALADVCCTSSNAVRVVQNIAADEIIFVPDKNLGHYVSRFIDKKIILWDGFCYVHARITPADVQQSRKTFPDAPVVVHPECRPAVIDLADRVASTGGMVSLARETEANTVLIGTEEGLIQRLKRENPEKNFYTVGAPKICRNMKLTTLEDVYRALKEEIHAIDVPADTAQKAGNALKAMLEYS